MSDEDPADLPAAAASSLLAPPGDDDLPPGQEYDQAIANYKRRGRRNSSLFRLQDEERDFEGSITHDPPPHKIEDLYEGEGGPDDLAKTGRARSRLSGHSPAAMGLDPAGPPTQPVETNRSTIVDGADGRGNGPMKPQRGPIVAENGAAAPAAVAAAAADSAATNGHQAAPTGRARRRTNTHQQAKVTYAQASAESLQMMEELHDKLKLLDYETLFCKPKKLEPLNRFYFLSPASDISRQQYYFLSLAHWMMSLMNHRFPAPQQFDDPNITSANMLVELKAVGIPANFPPTKLKQGSGDTVCQVLHTLVKKTLGHVFKFKSIVLAPDEYDEEVNEDAEEDLVEAGDDIDEEIEVAEEEEVGYMEHRGPGDGGHGATAPAAETAVLHSGISPEQWQLELERVRPLLKVKIAADARDWRSHVLELKQHHKVIKENMDFAASNIERISGEISKAADKIEQRENTINQQLDHVVADYKVAHEAYQSANEAYQQNSGSLDKLTNELASLNEELDTIKAELDDRSNLMGDSTPLAKIKSAIQALKKEIKQLDLRIGVSHSSLVNFKLRDPRRRGAPSDSLAGLKQHAASAHDADDDEEEYDF